MATLRNHFRTVTPAASTLAVAALAFALLCSTGCKRDAATAHGESIDSAITTATATDPPPSTPAMADAKADPPLGYDPTSKNYRGFDRNDYPGDATMSAMRSQFAFTGYWLTPPPGEIANSWLAKRDVLLRQGWGFLLLANGKLEKEILAAQKHGLTPQALGQQDANVAIAAAQDQRFPAHAIIFLDQEEGGRLTDPQAAYLLAWTEAVAASTYKPGVYASGQLTSDDPGTVIDTIRDIRARIAQQHLHAVDIFDYQDACPPAPGCTLAAKPLSAAGEPEISASGNLIAWQYAQSPRRAEITKACANTYAADGNCYVPSSPKTFLDLDIASIPDPSHAR